MRYFILASVLIWSSSCARAKRVSPSTPWAELPSSCRAVTGDVSSAAGMNVYPACEVDKPAVAPIADRPVTFNPVTKRLGCFRATLELVVDTAGAPVRRTIKVLAADDPNFASAVSGHVMSLRWKPAMLGGLPVGQVVRYEKVDQLLPPPKTSSTTAPVHAAKPKC